MAKPKGPAANKGSSPTQNASSKPQSGLNPTASLRLLATTDLHMHLLPWDYYTDTPSRSRGLSLLASLIRTARSESAQSVLVDNGDFLQGSPIGDFLAETTGAAHRTAHPMIAAMNHLAYDAVGIGNHEFSHGLDFLAQSMATARFPVLSANALTQQGNSPKDDRFLFAPTTMVTRMIALAGQPPRALRIGIVGLTPSQVAQWERDALGERIVMRGLFEAAQFHLDQLRAQGADLVIALAHSGLGEPSLQAEQENMVIRLARDLRFDAIVAGHTHNLFPSDELPPADGFDPLGGLIHGTPVVMPGFYGSHLGVIDLELAPLPRGKWQVRGAKVALRAVFERTSGDRLVSSVDEDPDIRAIALGAHDQTRRWARRKIGATSVPLHSYFALVSPSESVRLVARAQADHVRRALRGSVWEGVPILSAAAPFRTGGRSGAENFTDVPAGPISLRNIADLYTFPNTVVALILSGAEVRDWLERAAAQFNTVPSGARDAELINADMPGFDFDMIDGVTYEIDLSGEARFDAVGRLVNPQAGRIRQLCCKGVPLDPAARFVLVSNSYRLGGGGGYAMARPSRQILRGGPSIRDLVAGYVSQSGNFTAERPFWRFAAMPGTSVIFDSSPKASGLTLQMTALNIVPLARQSNGFQRFRMNL